LVIVRRGKTPKGSHLQIIMYYYRRKAMVMSGCNVVQTVENHGEAFGGAISDKKITKRPTCIIEVGTIDVGGL
jgi:hypothetical protein